MVRSYYVDTSVLGGYFDAEFREPTHAFWATLLAGKCHALVSTLTVEELVDAPTDVRRLLDEVPAGALTVLPVSDEVRELAARYVDMGVLGPASKADGLHVAVATLSAASAIVSWNFKHLVNLRRVQGFNGVNLLMGYRAIDIRTPREVIDS